jgi:hypothetical protein
MRWEWEEEVSRVDAPNFVGNCTTVHISDSMTLRGHFGTRPRHEKKSKRDVQILVISITTARMYVS